MKKTILSKLLTKDAKIQEIIKTIKKEDLIWQKKSKTYL